MPASIDIPHKWKLSSESDGELAQEGDSIVFRNTENGVICQVVGVKEVSDRLDFLGEVLDEDGEELEQLWLASDDFPTVSHTREEILKWIEGQMKSYDHY